MDLYLTGSWEENSLAYVSVNFRKCSNETYVAFENKKTEEEQKIFDDFLHHDGKAKGDEDLISMGPFVKVFDQPALHDEANNQHYRD